MGNRSLFPVVAVPRAFFGTFFRFERKYFPPRGGSPTTRAGVGASIPHRGKGDCACGRPKGFLLTLWKPSGTKVARKPMDGNPAVRTEVGAPDPCKGPLRSIVFPGPISPMESLLLFLDIPLFGAPTPRCRIAFFSFFSFAAESKRSPPSSRLNPAPSWYVFSVGNPRLRKRSGTTFRSGFSLFFS